MAVTKSLDRKLAALHADPQGCREFILADAKDADMAFGIGAPGLSPESHVGEVRLRTLEEYRDQMRAVVRQGIVDIMLMSVHSSARLTLEEKIFEHSHVTPAIRANDTSDIHLARGGVYGSYPAQPFRTASLDHAQCGYLDCKPEDRHLGANLGLYSVTFNNDPVHDLEALRRFKEFREEAERKGFRYFLEVFDPNIPGSVAPDKLPGYINDMIARMLAGVGPAGRPDFLKMVYHGPKAMEELFRYDPDLIIGIMGGGAGTTRDAFQLLHDAQAAGARVALYGRKINQAENQLAFIHMLRLIVDGVVKPVEAVKAYHAVLAKLGLRPQRPLEEDLKQTVTATNYSGTTTSVTVPPSPAKAAVSTGGSASPAPAPAPAVAAACPGPAAGNNGKASGCGCGCKGEKKAKPAFPAFADGRPDFSRMSSADRLEYHRRRLGFSL